MKKKATVFLAILFTFLALCVSVGADSYSDIRDKVKSVAGRYKEYAWAIKDIDGDGTVEGLLEFHAPGRGSNRTFQVYRYQDGKVIKALSDAEYGLEKITSYKKGFVAYGAGHGGEWYRYYRLQNGKYKLAAIKARVAVAGGSGYNGAWNYRDVYGNVLKKAAFRAAIKGISSGKKVVVKL